MYWTFPKFSTEKRRPACGWFCVFGYWGEYWGEDYSGDYWGEDSAHFSRHGNICNLSSLSSASPPINPLPFSSLALRLLKTLCTTFVTCPHTPASPFSLGLFNPSSGGLGGGGGNLHRICQLPPNPSSLPPFALQHLYCTTWSHLSCSFRMIHGIPSKQIGLHPFSIRTTDRSIVGEKVLISPVLH